MKWTSRGPYHDQELDCEVSFDHDQELEDDSCFVADDHQDVKYDVSASLDENQPHIPGLIMRDNRTIKIKVVLCICSCRQEKEAQRHFHGLKQRRTISRVLI
jgi:hypothetical protein